MSWSDEDPRFTVGKRADIVIVRGRGYGQRACLAQVETKHSWHVSTGFPEPHRHVGSGDDWPEGWRWTFAPRD